MIQRIQSLYLTFVMLLSLLFLLGGVYKFADGTGKEIYLMLNGNLTDQTGQFFSQIHTVWPLRIIIILISALSIVTISLYKNRKVQLLLGLSLILLASGLIIALSWYAFNIVHAFKLTVIPGIKMAIPVLILIFSILAYRGILKDDRLVKSYDRLR
jgi:hypothetical protein